MVVTCSQTRHGTPSALDLTKKSVNFWEALLFQPTDARTEYCGQFCVIYLLTDRSKNWMVKNVPAGVWRGNNGLVVDREQVDAILQRMVGDGFNVPFICRER